MSAALARKKGKGLHKDMAIFWHKKKISEFAVILGIVSSSLCPRPSELSPVPGWGWLSVCPVSVSVSVSSSGTSCDN